MHKLFLIRISNLHVYKAKLLMMSQTPVNDSHVDSSNYMLYKSHTYITFGLLPFIIFLDGLIIAAIIIFRKFHNVHHMLLLGQVLTDVMYAVFIPFFILSQDNTWVKVANKDICSSLWAIFTTLQHNGLYFYVFITLDHFIALTYPFWYSAKITSRKYGTIAVVMVFVLSFLAGGIGIPFNIQYDECNYYRVIPRTHLILLHVEFIIVPIAPLIMNIHIIKTSHKIAWKSEKATFHAQE